MRVVVCGPYPYDADDWASADGLTHCVATLAEELRGIGGVEAHVVTRSRKVGSTETRRVDGGSVTWVPDRMVAADYFMGRYLVRRQIMNAVSTLRPDVVHAHGEAPYILAALDLSIPHVVTLHGIFAEQTRAHGPSVPASLRVAYALMRRSERAYVPRFRHVIAISDEIARYVRQVNQDCVIERVDNPIDRCFFSITRAEAVDPVVLFVGQLSRRKGVHLLLDAFARVSSANEDVRLRIAGGEEQDPAYAAEMRRVAASLGEGRVSFLGAMTHERVAEELSRAWVYCLPSLYEASPLAVTEALAAGTPVVASDVGDTIALLSSGGGLVVPAGNVERLAASLEHLICDDEARARCGARGRAEASRRAAPAMIARHTLAVYARVVEEAKSVPYLAPRS